MGGGGLRRGVLNLGANKIYQLACVFFFHVPNPIDGSGIFQMVESQAQRAATRYFFNNFSENENFPRNKFGLGAGARPEPTPGPDNEPSCANLISSYYTQ